MSPRQLVASAIFSLLLGLAVYLLDRDWHASLFLRAIAPHQVERRAAFGVLGGWLPSFFHAYALATLLVVGLCRSAWSRSAACLLWFAIAASLEFAQARPIAHWLILERRSMDAIPGSDFFLLYAANGHFDPADLLATACGCVAAYFLTTTQRQTACSHPKMAN